MKKKYLKVVGNILTILALLVIVKRLWEMNIDYTILIEQKHMVWLILLIVMYAIYLELIPFSWREIIKIITHNKISFLDLQKVFCKSNMLKYLPGNIFQYVGRNEIAILYKLEHKKIAFSTVLDILANVLGVFLVSCICYSRGFLIGINSISLKFNWEFGVVFVILIIVCLYFAWKKRNVFWPQIQNICTGSNIRKYIGCIFYYMFGAVYTGLIYIFVITKILETSIATNKIYIVIGAFLLSWLFGFITPGAPGGIGIRETVITALLSTQMQENIVLLAIVIYRIINIFGDCLAYVSSQLSCKLRDYLKSR